MSIDRWMDKDVAQTQWNNSHEKEWIWVSWNKVDEPQACYMERENNCSMLMYTMRHPEKWHWCPNLQGGNRNTDSLLNTQEEEGGMNRESNTAIYTPPRAKTANGKLPHDKGAKPGALWPPQGVGWWGRGAQQRRDVHHTYAWFVVLYSRNQHNTVKQLSSN